MTVTYVVDEETPLLQSQPKKRTPLPWLQITIVSLLQLGEPLASQVIYPFAPQLIRGLGITGGDETKVGYYVGIIESLFFLAQACTVLYWSRLSDHIGRKPVILIGLFGLSLSMYCFGLSTTFGSLIVSRALNGALNGNVGVMKSMTVEMSDSTNLSQAVAYMSIMWFMGATIAPIIGGTLSRPADQFPSLFGNDEFLKTYPYFLPCAVTATYAVCGWLTAYFLLKETVKYPTPLKDVLFTFKEKKESGHKQIITIDHDNNESPVPLRSLLTFPVMVAAANYATLGLVEIAFRAIQPLFLSTPVELGGLGLPPSTIGKILSVIGILNGCFQVMFFARINDYWGSKKVFMTSVASGIPIFLSFPIISHIARTEGYTFTLWIAIGVQVIFSILLSLGYSAIFIFISHASPNKASLGATNGLCQALVSTMRTIGPAVTNSLFSLSISRNYLGGYLVYYLLLVMVGIALFTASFLPSSTIRA